MPVTLITVSSGCFLSVETFCVNGRAHATARYEAGTLVGQHIDCVTFFAQFCEWLRSRIRSCSRDYGARRADD